jgi:Ca2+-binding EF-hand superfamily protein
MRILFALIAVPLLTLSAQAQTTKTEPTKTAASTHKHMTLEQRFDQANVTHDGHLTEEQAQSGYKSVAKHFAAIDKDKKGYVTEDDIRAYYKTQHELHHQASTTHHQPNG